MSRSNHTGLQDWFVEQAWSLAILLNGFKDWARQPWRLRNAHRSLRSLAIIGDSLCLTVGNVSFASILAHQLGVSITHPELREGAAPLRSTLIDDLCPPSVLQPSGRTTMFKPTLSIHGFAVRSATVRDALFAPCFASLESLLTNCPHAASGFEPRLYSQLESAERLRPSCTIVWLGSNDVLAVLDKTGASSPGGRDSFEAHYREILSRLRAAGSELVLCNLPDITDLPYLISTKKLSAMVNRSDLELEQFVGIGSDDYITRLALPEVAEILAGRLPGPLNRQWRLERSSVEKAGAMAGECNRLISCLAEEYNAHLVDVRSLTEHIHRRGVKIGRYRLTSELSSGVFSVDGIHPSIIGHALIANRVIGTLNRAFGCCIPRMNMYQILTRGLRLSDPLADDLDESMDPESPVGSLKEGQDYYREKDSIVMTAHYHLKRGYCCLAGCRHCPYGVPAQQQRIQS